MMDGCKTNGRKFLKKEIFLVRFFECKPGYSMLEPVLLSIYLEIESSLIAIQLCNSSVLIKQNKRIGTFQFHLFRLFFKFSETSYRSD